MIPTEPANGSHSFVTALGGPYGKVEADQRHTRAPTEDEVAHGLRVEMEAGVEIGVKNALYGSFVEPEAGHCG